MSLPDSQELQLAGEYTDDSKTAEENTKPVRGCVVNPLYEPLTEDTLLKLEQSHPRYRLAQRNLEH
jgi:hypothetical protein